MNRAVILSLLVSIAASGLLTLQLTHTQHGGGLPMEKNHPSKRSGEPPDD